jgi:hypothetical protein
MKFRILVVVSAILSFLLGVGYLFFGGLLIGRWGIEATSGMLLLGRRMAALYLGLSVMFFLARSAPVSVPRMAICAGAAVGMSLLALLGIYERTAGHAGPGILVSVLVESLIALAFIWTLFTERRPTIGG